MKELHQLWLHRDTRELYAVRLHWDPDTDRLSVVGPHALSCRFAPHALAEAVARGIGHVDPEPSFKATEVVDKDLGGFDKMRADFVQAGVTQFGSGWAWLQVKNGKLEISKTPNGENPLVHGATPILGVDVWEHSYYIDYRNRRPDYLKAFVDHLVNWEYVDQLFSKA